MNKFLIVFFLTLFLLSPLLSIKAAEEPNSEVELDLTQFSGEVAGPPHVIVNDAKLRYGWDLLIYGGKVNVNTWAVPNGVDDESIDVNYFAGDTLRAVVATPDSMVRIFRSNDKGQNWSQVTSFYFPSGGAAEPSIVHGPDSTYHVFCLYVTAENDIYTLAFRTANDAVISGTGYYLSGDDSVQNYSVCTNRSTHHDYSVYLVYQAGSGVSSRIRFSRTTDMGQNWSTPTQITSANVGLPDITYGAGDILYLSYICTPGNYYYPRVRRSLNSGSNWSSFINLETDTMPTMAPQIAAAYDGSGDVWVIWPKKNLLAANQDWDLYWSWSQDSGIIWSSAATVGSLADSNDYLPSIAVNDYNGSAENTPSVSFVRASSGGANPSVRTFTWSSGAWSTVTRYSNYGTSLTRPVQTFSDETPYPAIAYVGESSENVYFDSWTSSGNEEKDITSNGKITCSLDKSIIAGTATLKYTVKEAGKVKISMFNILGQEVVTLLDGEQGSGEHTLNINSNNLAKGIYYILIKISTGTHTLKATVL